MEPTDDSQRWTCWHDRGVRAAVTASGKRRHRAAWVAVCPGPTYLEVLRQALSLGYEEERLVVRVFGSPPGTIRDVALPQFIGTVETRVHKIRVGREPIKGN